MCRPIQLQGGVVKKAYALTSAATYSGSFNHFTFAGVTYSLFYPYFMWEIPGAMFKVLETLSSNSLLIYRFDVTDPSWVTTTTAASSATYGTPPSCRRGHASTSGDQLAERSCVTASTMMGPANLAGDWTGLYMVDNYLLRVVSFKPPFPSFLGHLC